MDAEARTEKQEHRNQRAPQACLRCRRKKLRCTGGCPCSKCIRVKEVCDFGERGEGLLGVQVSGVDSTVRIAQLEKTVATLLADLAVLRPDPSNATGTSGYMANGVQSSAAAISTTSHFPPQPFFDTPSLSGIDTRDAPVPPASIPPVFTALPCPPVTSAFARTVRFGPSPDKSSGSPASDKRKEKDKGSPQDRLAAASGEGQVFAAPFQPLTYQPALWDNKEQSRRSSPQPGGPSRDEAWPAFEANAGPKDDPLTTNLINVSQAESLFDLYVARHR